jgi:hypothetical protein
MKNFEQLKTGPLYELIVERHGNDMAAINAALELAYDIGWWDSRIAAIEAQVKAANLAYDKATQLEASK